MTDRLVDSHFFVCLKITGGIVKILYKWLLLLSVAGEMDCFSLFDMSGKVGGGKHLKFENPKPFGKEL